MIIEFSGTPGAGKNSIIELICSNKMYGNCKVIAQDDEEFTIENSNFDLRILWGIFDTYSKIKADVIKHNTLEKRLFIFHRGLFDMIAWARLLQFNNDCYAEVGDYIERWLRNRIVTSPTDIIFLVLTSYEKILIRRERHRVELNRSSWIVNRNTIEKLNEIYLDIFREFQREFSIVLIDDLNKDLTLEQKFSIVSSYLQKSRS